MPANAGSCICHYLYRFARYLGLLSVISTFFTVSLLPRNPKFIFIMFNENPVLIGTVAAFPKVAFQLHS